jgi:hypothetical protein
MVYWLTVYWLVVYRLIVYWLAFYRLVVVGIGHPQPPAVYIVRGLAPSPDSSSSNPFDLSTVVYQLIKTTDRSLTKFPPIDIRI